MTKKRYKRPKPILSLEGFFMFAKSKPPISPTKERYYEYENGDWCIIDGKPIYYLRRYDIFFHEENIVKLFAEDKNCLGYYC